MRYSNYSIGEIISNIFFLIKTKFFFPSSRMIRFPIVIRGKKYIDFGRNLTTGKYCRFDVVGRQEKKCLLFGENVNIGFNVRISCAKGITIGDNVLIGSGVLITDNCHGIYSGNSQDAPDSVPNNRQLSVASIEIGNNVWIGEGVVIMKGVCIGEGAIIGANSVVDKDISSSSIAVGVPAKVIKIYNKETKTWERI